MRPGAESVETPEPILRRASQTSRTANPKQRRGGRDAARKRNPRPVPEEERDDDQEVTDLDLASLENLDSRELAGMMTPNLIRQIITANRGIDEFEEWEDAPPARKPGNGSNGKHKSNGKHGSNGKGSNGNGSHGNGRKPR